MGYTTEFQGEFKLNKKLDDTMKDFLTMFSETRRMKWDLGPEYGVEGEFYVGHHERFSGCYAGQVERNTPHLLEYNNPPYTQPSLWCQWIPSDCGSSIVWYGGEKFYHYYEWIVYIVDNFLAPNGYILNGEVYYQGEIYGDFGSIKIDNNHVTMNERKRLP
jgi:hypothetical protein